MKVETGEIGSGAEKDAVGAFFGGFVVDEDVDILNLGKVANDFGVDPGNGLKFSRPVFGVMGPGDPGGGVRSPLGGHAVGFVGWTGHVIFRHSSIVSLLLPPPAKKCAKSSIERL